jgi:hypothetical protein
MPIDEGWFFLTTFSDLNTAVRVYATRFQLEEMFRDFKLYGFNLELTQFLYYLNSLWLYLRIKIAKIMNRVFIT